MSKISCIRKLNFCAGHRVVGHENKCAHMHGHEYLAEIYARPKETLDDIGRVIDFSVIKERVGNWIDRYWDHGFIVNKTDIAALSAIKAFNDHSQFDQKYFELPYNPTAENLARFLLETCKDLFTEYPIEIYKVVIHETPNCRGIYET